ncbi:MAG TPA: iron-sulfur cluster repair di-iron protein [Terriglobales bacterium]
MIAAGQETVKDLAVQVPGAARVFEQFGIDYCCHGNIPLSEACDRAGLPLEDVLSSLKRAQQEPAPAESWSQAPLAALAAHIVAKHHAFTKAETSRLEALFAKVSAKHGSTHPELPSMQVTFGEMASELCTHMLKEENILFPYLTAMEKAIAEKRTLPPAMFGSVENPVRVMMKEHDDAGEALRALREASHGYVAPEGACVSYRELYRSLAAFETDMHTHVHLENNVLFPRALEMEAAAI